MVKIFISYRRDDTGFGADRVHEAALEYVDDPTDVFMDIDGVPPGADFVDIISERIAECDVLFALIGRDWLNAADPESGLRRLDDQNDFVRIEIASALARDIPVVPILLGGATMPRATDLPDDLKLLARRNASRVGRASFKSDMVGLMSGLGLSSDRKRAPSMNDAEDESKEQTLTFALIENSLSRADYHRFLKRYPNGPEAFEAERRIDQLESWAQLDKSNTALIESWLFDRSDRVFEALANEARNHLGSNHNADRIEDKTRTTEERVSNFNMWWMSVLLIFGAALAVAAIRWTIIWVRW